MKNSEHLGLREFLFCKHYFHRINDTLYIRWGAKKIEHEFNAIFC